MSQRLAVYQYIQEHYGCEPEYPWVHFPNYAVFRHENNRKWFALLMDVPYERLGRAEEGRVVILNVKLSDPLLVDLVVQQPGILRGYHIQKGNWISILLDGTVPFDEVTKWLQESYSVTTTIPKKKNNPDA